MLESSLSLPQASNNYLNTAVIIYWIQTLSATKAWKHKFVPAYIQQNETQLTKYHKTQWEHWHMYASYFN